MNTQPVTNKDQALFLIKEAAIKIREDVKVIESRPQLTQNHYGKYMEMLSRYEGRNAITSVALVLIEAGANKAGVIAARNLLV